MGCYLGILDPTRSWGRKGEKKIKNGGGCKKGKGENGKKRKKRGGMREKGEKRRINGGEREKRVEEERKRGGEKGKEEKRGEMGKAGDKGG